jgi:hypothetical protein
MTAPGVQELTFHLQSVPDVDSLTALVMGGER